MEGPSKGRNSVYEEGPVRDLARFLIRNPLIPPPAELLEPFEVDEVAIPAGIMPRGGKKVVVKAGANGQKYVMFED